MQPQHEVSDVHRRRRVAVVRGRTRVLRRARRLCCGRVPASGRGVVQLARRRSSSALVVFAVCAMTMVLVSSATSCGDSTNARVSSDASADVIDEEQPDVSVADATGDTLVSLDVGAEASTEDGSCFDDANVQNCGQASTKVACIQCCEAAHPCGTATFNGDVRSCACSSSVCAGEGGLGPCRPGRLRRGT
jgi:hypothetical protein